ncbi:uncharacterized protein VTP21DRAFT_7867 [Calcarisporiella thermophila]|uniref:uncharacterized protein n=1 Tax=Calcarisporiella thermophila TaxID=911321 RepID=UPI003743048D
MSDQSTTDATNLPKNDFKGISPDSSSFRDENDPQIESLAALTASLAATTSSNLHRDPKLAPIARRSREENQEERRRKALEEQKKRRRDFTDHARNLALFKLKDEEVSEESDEDESDFGSIGDLSTLKGEKRKYSSEEEEAVDDISRDGIAHKKLRQKGRFRPDRKKKKSNPYKNQIMFAEWMSEVPKDLLENWYLITCPAGKRCLVSSANGKTVSRLRNGLIFDTFQSVLPAGSKSYKGNRSSDYCILDCIYDPNSLTYYVLDIMCWKGHPIYDCETEFRFYWLQTKIAELDSPTAHNGTFTFQPLLPRVIDSPLLNEVVSLSKMGSEESTSLLGFRLDGFLFYHKRTHYVLGTTPLCCWIGVERTAEILLSRNESGDGMLEG